jgi:hypothetical protein
MPEFPSEKIPGGSTELATKVGLFIMAAGLILAGILTVIVLVSSILYVSDRGMQDARLDQLSTQSLAGDPKRDRL